MGPCARRQISLSAMLYGWWGHRVTKNEGVNAFGIGIAGFVVERAEGRRVILVSYFTIARFFPNLVSLVCS